MLKSELRQQMRELKRQFTQQQLDELSLSVILRLKPLLAEAHTVLAFYSLPDEVNTHQLVDDLVAEGKTLLLPKVLDDATMELRRYTGQSDLEEGNHFRKYILSVSVSTSRKLPKCQQMNTIWQSMRLFS